MFYTPLNLLKVAWIRSLSIFFKNPSNVHVRFSIHNEWKVMKNMIIIAICYEVINFIFSILYQILFEAAKEVKYGWY